MGVSCRWNRELEFKVCWGIDFHKSSIACGVFSILCRLKIHFKRTQFHRYQSTFANKLRSLGCITSVSFRGRTRMPDVCIGRQTPVVAGVQSLLKTPPQLTNRIWIGQMVACENNRWSSTKICSESIGWLTLHIRRQLWKVMCGKTLLMLLVRISCTRTIGLRQHLCLLFNRQKAMWSGRNRRNKRGDQKLFQWLRKCCFQELLLWVQHCSTRSRRIRKSMWMNWSMTFQ